MTDPVLRLILNLLWMTLGGGFVIALEYLLGGLLVCLTIVGIPFGIQAFKLGWLSLLPFGREVAQRDPSPGCLITGLNIVWLVVAGIWIAISHLVLAFWCVITIIGIPFALQHLKLAHLSLLPFGKEINLIERPVRQQVREVAPKTWRQRI